MSCRRRCLLLGVLLLAMAPAFLRAQDGDGTVRTDFINQGGGRSGSLGYFGLASAEVLRPAQMNLGFFLERQVGMSTAAGLPVFFGYGIAKLSEAHAWMYPTHNMIRDTREHNAGHGLKAMLLSTEQLFASIVVSGESSSIDAPGGETQRSLRVSGMALLTAVLPGDIACTVAAGYGWMPDSRRAAESHMRAGAGALLAVSSDVALLADVEGKLYREGAGTIDLHAGAKYFILEHIQLMGGYHAQAGIGTSVHGLFFGLSFCTETLQARRSPAQDESFPQLPSLEDLDAREDESGDDEANDAAGAAEEREK